MRTDEESMIAESKTRNKSTRLIEEALRPHFDQVDAYQYVEYVIRVRVVDPRFSGMRRDDRRAMVWPHLDDLPEDVRADIASLLVFAPDELEKAVGNFEFENPSPLEF